MLELSPLEFRFSLDDSSTFRESFTVTNSGPEPLSVRFVAAPAPGLENPAYGALARWVSFSESSVTLPPGASQTISFSVTAPDSLPAGGQYAVLYAEALPETSGEGIDLLSRVGLRLYASSSAEARRSVGFSSPELPWILVGAPLSTSLTVTNSGNLDFSVVTSFTVTSPSGKQLYTDSVSTELLPESSKTVYQEWGDSPSFGLYRLNYTAQALDTSLSASRLVFVFSPLSLVLLGLIFLSLVAALLFRRSR
ncbi:hypothetical protein IJ095_01045 [Candidatus Saccharibacteria bacterium]|nr:hypothetical protein [Candidatus Saccharibacteria bacterium]